MIDAANVMGSRPDGWWRDRAAAVRRLLTAIVEAGPHPEDITVVVEGAARSGADEGVRDGIRIVHAMGSGDDAMVDIVGVEAPDRPVTVVTADRELRARVTALGADVRGPRDYLDSLTAHG